MLGFFYRAIKYIHFLEGRCEEYEKKALDAEYSDGRVRVWFYEFMAILYGFAAIFNALLLLVFLLFILSSPLVLSYFIVTGMKV